MKKTASPKQKSKKRGRPRKGGERPPKPTRLAQPLSGPLSLKEMINALPTACDIGVKRKAKGHTVKGQGDKRHSDAAYEDIPIRCLLSTTSLHDSQAAIPLLSLTLGQKTVINRPF
ncbi:MAG: hypothetical protein OXC68_00715 [Aestuariivita sp.]|nr:hypothetical protein [Aestuariivita sp.]